MNSKEERDKIHKLISEKVEAHIKKVNEAALNLGLGSLNTSAESGRRQGYYSGYSEAMTEYRSIGEREAREQVINELVGWMEEQSSVCWVKDPSADEVFTMCIHKAKSLLNQQGEETKK